MFWLLPGTGNEILNRAGVPYGVLVVEPSQVRMVYSKDQLRDVWTDLQGEGWIRSVRSPDEMIFNKPEVEGLLAGFSEVYTEILKVYMKRLRLVIPAWSVVKCDDCGGVLHFVRQRDGRHEEIAERISTVLDAFEQASEHVRKGEMDVDTAIILIVNAALLEIPMDWDEYCKRENREAKAREKLNRQQELSVSPTPTHDPLSARRGPSFCEDPWDDSCDDDLAE